MTTTPMTTTALATEADDDDDSNARSARQFLRSSREQLLEDLAVKDRDLRSCERVRDKRARPWVVTAVLWLATVLLLVVVVWGIVALVYGSRLSNGVAAARVELATLNAKIAERLQLLDDTQHVVQQLRAAASQTPQERSSVALRLAQLQHVLDNYPLGEPPTPVDGGRGGGGGGGGTAHGVVDASAPARAAVVVGGPSTPTRPAGAADASSAHLRRSALASAYPAAPAPMPQLPPPPAPGQERGTPVRL